jgi:hypothetical protein
MKFMHEIFNDDCLCFFGAVQDNFSKCVNVHICVYCFSFSWQHFVS